MAGSVRSRRHAGNGTAGASTSGNRPHFRGRSSTGGAVGTARGTRKAPNRSWSGAIPLHVAALAAGVHLPEKFGLRFSM